MARNIAYRGPLRGKALIVFNRDRQRFFDLQSSLPPEAKNNITLGASAEKAAEAATITFTSLGNDQSVVDIYDQILSGNGNDVTGKIFVETTTILPETTELVAQKVTQAGGEFVAMPGRWSLVLIATTSGPRAPWGNWPAPRPPLTS